MKCARCRQSFCWLCGQSIDAGEFPSHFKWYVMKEGSAAWSCPLPLYAYAPEPPPPLPRPRDVYGANGIGWMIAALSYH
jgi:hypothetical protein